jgi:hypothetical protein
MGKSGKKDYDGFMQAFLSKHSQSTAHHSIKVEWAREADLVSVSFTVQKRDGSPWKTDPAFSQDWSKNWGLWNNDVVESFLQLRSAPEDLQAPYLEIQVSPLNQPFALIITEPRKTFFAPQILSFTTESEVEGRSWRAKLSVKLPGDLKGSSLYGGFFSCLALSDGSREFYALEPNPEATPDFHRPELFVRLQDL